MSSSPAKSRFGLSCALATPFTKSDAIDFARLVEHAQWCIANGCDGVTIFGTTGEGAHVGVGPREGVFAAVAKSGIAMGTVMAGVSACAVEDAVTQSRIALDAGCKGLLTLPPFYFHSAGEEGIYAWFSRYIEAIGADARGVFLYNIPQLTNIWFSPELVGRLKKAYPGVVVGVKDSSCTWAHTEKLLDAHASDMAILVGDERDLARAVRKGGEGSICGVANIWPQALVPLVHEGRDDARIIELVTAIVAHPVIPAVKALVAHARGDAEWARAIPPLETLDGAAARSLAATFDRITAAKAA